MEREFGPGFIREVEQIMHNRIADSMTRVGIEIHNRLTARTPVDTGQARAGWNFTKNSPDFSAPPRPKKGDPVLPPKESVPDKLATKMTDSYFIANAVEHIVYLNSLGVEDKVPENWVEEEIAAGLRAVERSGL